MEEAETTHTEKAYCCSNLPQTEAALISKFDLALESFGLLISIIFIAVVASSNTAELIPTNPTQKPQVAQKLPLEQNHTVANDPSQFLHWSQDIQLVILSFSIFGRVVGIAFAVLLFFGVRKKNHAHLLTWFIYTFIGWLISLTSGIVIIVLATDRVLFSIITVVSFLYKWYCLWIVKLLMSEIRAVREGYANPLDDGEIDQANNLVPSSDSFTVDKF
ncbi:unnamed protein product [Orchesella dallaii]|uniref:Uncharacterized protein n=1 Tax=Orchesella dallaii TaxID=48710 RepID=A0ABP1Q914_9HEXA